ncbi:MAG: hypothetical protein HY245_09685, partial [Rhizobiales bacterium]|nr:hypothetical protein [Hyphomicrobiales bacterium]
GDTISNFEMVQGGSGNDTITGNGSDNSLAGGIGNDTLNGAGGNDTLTGGAGADSLTGGTGDDIFRYTAITEGGDTIIDFTGAGIAGGDRINLSAIDATPGGADDAFAYGGTSATAHGVWYSVSSGNATVNIDTDGNTATIELSMILNGVTSMVQGDFIL